VIIVFTVEIQPKKPHGLGGSPTHAWKILTKARRYTSNHRLTHARVENTPVWTTGQSSTLAHPRTRGENGMLIRV